MPAADLEKRLKAVEDKLELYQLFSAFGPHMDTGLAEPVADFFTEDGEWHMGGIPGVPPMFKGRDTFVSLLNGNMHQSLVQNGVAHTIGFPHITVDGDMAEALCYSVRFERHDGAWKPARVSANQFTCVRVQGHWKLQKRVNREVGTEEAKTLFRTANYDLPWT